MSGDGEGVWELVQVPAVPFVLLLGGIVSASDPQSK